MAMYVGDYMADTQGFSFEQHGAYHMLMYAYWANKGPLPEKKVRLVLQGREDLVEFLQDYFKVAAAGPAIGKPVMWHHKRIDQEIYAAEKRIESGKKAAAARWGSATA